MSLQIPEGQLNKQEAKEATKEILDAVFSVKDIKNKAEEISATIEHSKEETAATAEAAEQQLAILEADPNELKEGQEINTTYTTEIALAGAEANQAIKDVKEQIVAKNEQEPNINNQINTLNDEIQTFDFNSIPTDLQNELSVASGIENQERKLRVMQKIKNRIHDSLPTNAEAQAKDQEATKTETNKAEKVTKKFYKEELKTLNKELKEATKAYKENPTNENTETIAKIGKKMEAAEKDKATTEAHKETPNSTEDSEVLEPSAEAHMEATDTKQGQEETKESLEDECFTMIAEINALEGTKVADKEKVLNILNTEPTKELRQKTLEGLKGDLKRIIAEKEKADAKPEAITEASVEAELSTKTEEEKKEIALGLKNIGFWAEREKNKLFANAFNGLTSKSEDKHATSPTFVRFFKGIAKTYEDDTNKARKSMEGAEKGETKTLVQTGKLVGNITKFGRILTDTVGLTVASPLKGVMLASTVFAKGAEGAKEARLMNKEVIEQTRLDMDTAHEEAMNIYEQAQKKGGEVSKEDLNKAYQQNIPKDLLKRLSKDSTIKTGFLNEMAQKIAKADIQQSANSINNKLNKIDNNKKLSEGEKKQQKDRVLNKYSDHLKDLDRMVTNYGTVDGLALGAKYAQTAGKAASLGMIADTLIETSLKLPDIASDLSEATANLFNKTLDLVIPNANAEEIDKVYTKDQQENDLEIARADMQVEQEGRQLAQEQMLSTKSETIEKGSNLWDSSKKLFTDEAGKIDKKAFYKAWGESTVNIDGKEVPIHEINLVKPGTELYLDPETGKIEINNGEGMAKDLPKKVAANTATKIPETAETTATNQVTDIKRTLKSGQKIKFETGEGDTITIKSIEHGGNVGENGIIHYLDKEGNNQTLTQSERFNNIYYDSASEETYKFIDGKFNKFTKLDDYNLTNLTNIVETNTVNNETIPKITPEMAKEAGINIYNGINSEEENQLKFWSKNPQIKPSELKDILGIHAHGETDLSLDDISKNYNVVKNLPGRGGGKEVFLQLFNNPTNKSTLESFKQQILNGNNSIEGIEAIKDANGNITLNLDIRGNLVDINVHINANGTIAVDGYGSDNWNTDKPVPITFDNLRNMREYINNNIQ